MLVSTFIVSKVYNLSFVSPMYINDMVSYWWSICVSGVSKLYFELRDDLVVIIGNKLNNLFSASGDSGKQIRTRSTIKEEPIPYLD